MNGKKQEAQKTARNTKSKLELFADFETCTTEPTYVWLWAITDGVATVHGGDIESFLYHLFNNPKYHNTRIFFHNLKFDGNFIIHALIKYNIKFESSINVKGVWYRIEIPELGIEFYDSLKLLLTSLSNINDSFGFSYSKGTLDYSKIEYSIDSFMYIDNDVMLVHDAVKLLREGGMTKHTTAANALHLYKQSTNTFKNNFPVLELELVNRLKYAYKGGYSYCHRPGIHGKGIVLDVNSMYPHVMRNIPMPIGKPFDSKQKNGFTIYEVGMNADLKDGSFPVVPTEHKTKLSKYDSAVFERRFWVTEIDLERIHENYNVYDCQIISMYSFKTASGLFDNYIDKAMYEKTHAENAHQKFMAKIKLNSLYGKFAASPYFTKLTPIIENEVLKYVQEEAEETTTIYMPVGVAVTAHARNILMDTIQATLPRFIYCDTDSVHLTGWDIPDGVDIDDNKLGAWKIETFFDRGKFLRPKTYIEESGGELHVECAGMPYNCHGDVTFDNFEIGSSYTGKKMACNVQGGIIIKDRLFTLL